MKNSTYTTLIISILFLSTTTIYAQWGKNKVVGNGNVVSKEVTTPDYEMIKVMGDFDVQLEQGDEGTIIIKTDENLHEYIITEVKDNNTLVIRVKKSVTLKTRKGIHVTIPIRDLSGIKLLGSGEIDSKDIIKAYNFDIELSGSGDIHLDLNVTDLNARVNGSGDMSLEGNAKNFEVKISGSGDFDGAALYAENTQVYVSGSGDAKVSASSSIKARVNGSGEIKYAGGPELRDIKVSGSGTVKSLK